MSAMDLDALEAAPWLGTETTTRFLIKRLREAERALTTIRLRLLADDQIRLGARLLLIRTAESGLGLIRTGTGEGNGQK